MDLKHLKTFVVLAEKKGIIKAALYLNYSQSSITKHIQALEKELHVKLFEGNKSHLTPAGECLYSYAKKLLKEYDLVCNEVRAETHQERRIRVAGLEYYCFHYFMPFLRKLFDHHADIRIEILGGDMEEVYRKLREGQVDFAVVADYFIPDEFEMCFLDNEDVVILMSKDCYERDAHPETILERYPIMVHQFHKLNYNFFQRELDHPHIVECNSPEVIYESVMNYDTLGIVGTARYKDAIEDGSVVVLETLDAEIPVYLVTRKCTLMQPIKQELYDMFVQQHGRK
ncbi:LysR family transcriptional regulator [Bacillus sp. 1P06AnD]|uniref:LysR family transcriptional regulator n=1 Tax=Bacillus sp. 1P06AnD TaxID=3132208 RepID=UPI0039A0FFE4